MIKSKERSIKRKILLTIGVAITTLLGLSIYSAATTAPKMVEKTIYIPGSGQVYKVMAAPEKIDQTIYYGGDIVTMDGDKPVYVEAVVEKNGKIVFVGKKTEASSKYKNNSFEVDLEGKTMFPGFIDPHGHFMSAVMMVNRTFPTLTHGITVIYFHGNSRA